MTRYALTILLIVFSLSITRAQTAEIRGFVYEKKTGEPSIFTAVLLKGTTYGAKTDVNGFYSLTKVPAGEYTLVCSYLGFDTIKIPISLKAGSKINQNIFLEASSISLKTVDINSERTEALSDVRISTTKISPKQINMIPSVGGQPDLAQYLQVLPGVTFTGDQGGQLYIRGGAPIQNKVLLDGMVIYNPFHSIGLFSVFDVDIMRNVDVYTGGFSAEYGGRISAVMDITTRDGNKNRISGKASASPFVARCLVEGPLLKAKEGKSAASFLISAKSSFIEQSAKTLYAYADKDGLPYAFTDIYSKASINSANGSKFSLFGFNFSDRVSYASPLSLYWNSFGIGSNFVVVPPASSALISGNFAYSSYTTGLQEIMNSPRKSSIDGFNGGLNFSYFFGDDELKYGMEVLGFHTDFTFVNASNLTLQQEAFTTELAGYLKYKIVKGLWVVEPSLRGHYYASLSEFSPEPRLGIKFLANEKLRFKLAAGLYSQNLMSATSDRDVVNLFYGFLSAPENLPKTFQGQEVNSSLQKAAHIILGAEIDLGKYTTLNIETYRKYFNQLTNINRDKIYNDNLDNVSIPDRLKKDFIIETGLAQGLDFVLKYEKGPLYIWTVYSLAYVNRNDGAKTYFPHYDRRHTVNVVGSYRFGKKKTWEADLRFNFGSGFPFTQTQGIYEQQTFDDGINSNYTQGNGQIGVFYAELNKGRLPYYHRLDASLKKKWEFAKTKSLELNAGATNVYNRQNIFYFNALRFARKDQLPILPTLGATFTF